MWTRVTPDAAGFSSDALAVAHARLAGTASTGLVAIANGRIVFEFGSIDTADYVASVRKSILSMLFGIHVARGEIDLDATLDTLKIDDHEGLTDAERQATVRDLLTSRSGVFLPGANEGDDRAHAPARGTQRPGKYFLYSNWDFNVLGTVFEQSTGQGIFDAFERDIAAPIGLEDFRREEHRRTGDSTRSIHKAYHFRLSVRDMARLGLLMLRDGKWGDRQIIPSDWVRESTRPIVAVTEMNSAARRHDPWGYGYLWWVWDGAHTPAAYEGAYMAAGAFGQYIVVLPMLDLVVAQKSPLEEESEVTVGQFLSILDLIVTAKTGVVERVEVRVAERALRELVGEYVLATGVTLIITMENEALFAQFTGQEKAAIFAESEHAFFYRANNAQISFTRGASGSVTGLLLHQGGGRVSPARRKTV